MQFSDKLEKIGPALAKFQATVEGAKKDGQNPQARSKYASLASVWDAIRTPLTDNGLSLTQWVEDSDDLTVKVTSLLLHESGQWMMATGSLPLPRDLIKGGGGARGEVKADPQGAGSAITYLKRYGAMAITGVCGEDDDGNAAMGNRQQSDNSQNYRQETQRAQQDQSRRYEAQRSDNSSQNSPQNGSQGSDQEYEMITDQQKEAIDGICRRNDWAVDPKIHTWTKAKAGAWIQRQGRNGQRREGAR